MEDKINLKDYIYNIISEYDEEYANEQGINNFDDEDVYNIMSEVLQDNQLREIVQNEIEIYANFKNRR